MRKDERVFLKHMLDCISKIERSLKGVKKEDFERMEEKQAAVIRWLEVIGEAAKYLPEDFKSKHEEVPWSDIARTRDKLIHHYFGVDLDVVWEIVKKDLPELKEKLEKILGEFE